MPGSAGKRKSSRKASDETVPDGDTVGDLEEEIFLRSSASESIRSKKPQRKVYGTSETVAGWTARLSGLPSTEEELGLTFDIPTTSKMEEPDKAEKSVRPYNFAAPVKGKPPPPDKGKNDESMRDVSMMKRAPTTTQSAAEPRSAMTAPTSPSAGPLPCKPTKTLKREFFSLMKAQLPFLGFEKFLTMASSGGNKVDESLILLEYRRVKATAAIEADYYFHASYVDGYDKPKQFVAGQAPLVGLEKDKPPSPEKVFWTMIKSQKCPLVVILGQPRLASPFWPSAVSPAGEKATEDQSFEGGNVFIHRDQLTKTKSFHHMKLTVRVDGEEMKLELVEVLGWDVESLVPADFVALVGQVVTLYEGLVELKRAKHKGKADSWEAPPMAVVCRDGAKRSGTFIAATVALDRFLATGEMELFETCKAIRLQRYGALQNRLHYFSLHVALLQHLGLADKILNIKPVELERVEEELAVMIREIKAAPPGTKPKRKLKNFFKRK